MLVTFLRDAIGTYGRAQPGMVIDLPEDQASDLIRRGIAAPSKMIDTSEVMPERPFRLVHHSDAPAQTKAGASYALVEPLDMAPRIQGVARARRR